MTIPDFQTIMLPLLQFAGAGKEHSIHAAVDSLAKTFELTEDELNELLPSGKQTAFSNRVGWARTYLKKSGLLETPRRTYFNITDRGRSVLESNPPRIDMKFLRQFPEYLEFRKSKRKEKIETEEIEELEERTPEEVLEAAYQEIRDALVQDLLDQVITSPPVFFEQLVVELLVNMGYGGSRREAAKAMGKSGDEGIDGIIDEDRLGLDTIYIQAKRWQGAVGRPEIQKFVGALQGKKARKGIFITSSTFTPPAVEYVENIETKVILIDGNRLADFMIDYDVGVSEVTSYQIKKIDSDYFGET